MVPRAFTLIELLVVIAIIAILAVLLLSILAKPKAAGQNATCKNHLHENGLAMEMYVSDHNMYPPGLGGTPFQTWADWLAPYNPVPWTNVTSQCPTYITEGGAVVWQPPSPVGGYFTAFSGYAYNALGMLGRRVPRPEWQGLGELNLRVPDNRILDPSEMYCVGDTRPMQYPKMKGFIGTVTMRSWKLAVTGSVTEAMPPHAAGYNLLFADGHVNLVKRKDYLYPPRAAQNWNHDHQPHPEWWAPTDQWAVKN